MIGWRVRSISASKPSTRYCIRGLTHQTNISLAPVLIQPAWRPSMDVAAACCFGLGAALQHWRDDVFFDLLDDDLEQNGRQG